MKHLNQFITEYIIKKKLDKPIDSENKYKYFPKTKDELINNIKELFDKGETDLNCIATNKITNMADLFFNIRNINFDVSKWNVSNVTNMTNMFYNCKNFDCDLSSWDVSNVTNTAGMFYYCKNFDCGLSSWDVSNVTCMEYMFTGCEKFNCDLSDWDISNITRWKNMFGGCYNMTIPIWYKKLYIVKNKI